MVVETNLIDIKNITLDNYNTYNETIKYEISKEYIKRNISPSKKVMTQEDKIKHLKEYQHEYYLNITKPKRKKNRG